MDRYIVEDYFYDQDALFLFSHNILIICSLMCW